MLYRGNHRFVPHCLVIIMDHYIHQNDLPESNDLTIFPFCQLPCCSGHETRAACLVSSPEAQKAPLSLPSARAKLIDH
jgi:hypothetical protein